MITTTRSISLALVVLGATACKKPTPAEDEPGSAAPPATGTGAGTQAAAPAPSAPTVDPAMLAAFAPLPAAFEAASNPLTDPKLALGRMLYFDARLSKNHDVSCNTCHDLARFGVDGLPTSKGHKGQTGTRNSPTVYNAAGHVAQFWDGRAADVEAQAKGPILNPVEMAAVDEAHVVAVLASIPGYVEAFGKAWPDDPAPVTYQHVADAIGAFERKLVTPSRWDRYLAGDKAALTAEETHGLAVYLQSGCNACHSGPLLGGQMYQKLGLVKPWPSDKDLGRYAVTKQDTDKLFFKVPTLRNVARTAPYYHDGSIPDLAGAVRSMAEYQLGRSLSDADVAAIVSFLGALTGDLPSDYIAAPALPPSSKTTPRPDPS